MITVECPSCGADVLFVTAALPTRVCDHCRTILSRYQRSAEAIGVVAELPFDVSPLQIGTSGIWHGASFTIVGRIRWGWVDGAWNEWLISFDDGSIGWLAEAMGHFMLTAECPVDDGGAPLRKLAEGTAAKIGSEILVHEHTYQLVDQRFIRCIAAEGELPFPVAADRGVLSVDFRSPDGRFASFQRDTTGDHFYVGGYIALADLGLENMRVLPGWDLPVYG